MFSCGTVNFKKCPYTAFHLKLKCLFSAMGILTESTETLFQNFLPDTHIEASFSYIVKHLCL